MKVIDILEDVVPLDKYRDKKRFADAYADAERDQTVHGSQEEQAKQQYSKIMNDFEKDMKTARAPGFTDYKDMMLWLAEHKQGMKFKQMPREDRHKMKSIITHAPRIIRKLQTHVKRIGQFRDEWMEAAMSGQIKGHVNPIRWAHHRHEDLKDDIQVLHNVLYRAEKEDWLNENARHKRRRIS